MRLRFLVGKKAKSGLSMTGKNKKLHGNIFLFLNLHGKAANKKIASYPAKFHEFFTNFFCIDKNLFKSKRKYVYHLSVTVRRKSINFKVVGQSVM